MNMTRRAAFAALILTTLSISACGNDQETIEKESRETTTNEDFNPYINIHKNEDPFTHEIKIPFTEEQKKLLNEASWDDSLQGDIKLDRLGHLAFEVSPYVQYGELFIMTTDIDEPHLGRLFFPVEIGSACIFTSSINIDHENQQWSIKAHYLYIRDISRKTVSKCLGRYIDALQKEVENARDGNKWTPVPEPKHPADWQPISTE